MNAAFLIKLFVDIAPSLYFTQPTSITFIPNETHMAHHELTPPTFPRPNKTPKSMSVISNLPRPSANNVHAICCCFQKPLLNNIPSLQLPIRSRQATSLIACWSWAAGWRPLLVCVSILVNVYKTCNVALNDRRALTFESGHRRQIEIYWEMAMDETTNVDVIIIIGFDEVDSMYGHFHLPPPTVGGKHIVVVVVVWVSK